MKQFELTETSASALQLVSEMAPYSSRCIHQEESDFSRNSSSE